MKTRKRELTADKDLGPYYLREAHPAERRHKLPMGAIQTNMTEMDRGSQLENGGCKTPVTASGQDARQ